MSQSISSKDTQLSDILKGIDALSIQLPDFQRGWVWEDARIRALIASISCGYPVGAVMFLEYGSSNVRFKFHEFAGATPNNTITPNTLVLDGQQRLTSMYQALFCQKAVRTQTNTKKAIQRYYYLDIAKALDVNCERHEAIVGVDENKQIRKNIGRDIELDLSSRDYEFENRMFPLNIVFDFSTWQQWQNDYYQYHNYNPDVIKEFTQFSSSILTPMMGYSFPVITLGKNTPKEAVCQVFENVNTGGVPLTVFELVTASFAADDFELRKEWDTNINPILSKEPVLHKAVTPTDFLTAMTLLCSYKKNHNSNAAVSCKRKDVLNLQLVDFKTYEKDLIDGFVASARFLCQECCIYTSRELPYSTQLIPMSVLFVLAKNHLFTANGKKQLSRWYWCGIFGELYGGANETRYVNDVVGFMDWINGGGEPNTIQRCNFSPMRLLTLVTRISAAYKGINALILQNGAADFISGKKMDFASYADEKTDIHHIFPEDYCKKQGYPMELWNSVINKTPIYARTNRIVQGDAPSKYLERIIKNKQVDRADLNTYIGSHFIDEGSMWRDDFNDHICKRATMLLDAIVNATGKVVPGRDSQDVINKFGQAI